jgi:hypothetical protein
MRSRSVVDPGRALTSIIKGRFNMAIGIAAGANPGVALSNNVYAHAGAAGPGNPMKPWAEHAFALDIFGYHAESTFGLPDGATPPVTVVLDDKVWLTGPASVPSGIRWGSTPGVPGVAPRARRRH